MLILSRYPLESVVIGDHLFVTVKMIGTGHIELGVHDSETNANFSHRIKKDELIEIGPEIRVGFFDVREFEKGPKARLGIDLPRDVPVHRKEVWDALRDDRGPQ
jgi:sRNA-binding carbon storage regulator CsrA